MRRELRGQGLTSDGQSITSVRGVAVAPDETTTRKRVPSRDTSYGKPRPTIIGAENRRWTLDTLNVAACVVTAAANSVEWSCVR